MLFLEPSLQTFSKASIDFPAAQQSISTFDTAVAFAWRSSCRSFSESDNVYSGVSLDDIDADTQVAVLDPQSTAER